MYKKLYIIYYSIYSRENDIFQSKVKKVVDQTIIRSINVKCKI